MKVWKEAVGQTVADMKTVSAGCLTLFLSIAFSGSRCLESTPPSSRTLREIIQTKT